MTARIIRHDKMHQRHMKKRIARAPVTIPVMLVRGLLAGLEARGEPGTGYLDEAGIPADLLSHAGARVTAEQYIALFRVLVERRGDEGLGYLDRPLKPGSFALMARSAVGARDFGEALTRIVSTFQLLRDDEAIELRVEGGLAGLVLRFANESPREPQFLRSFRHTFFLRSFWLLTGWVAGGRLPIRRFDFALPSLPLSHYSEPFPAAQRFGQPATALWFDPSWLQAPVSRDQAALQAFLAGAPGNIIIPVRREDPVSKRVRNHLRRSQPRWSNLADAATALNMSTATLQRRLAAERTTFQALKDELRRDIAIERLNTSDVRLTELAAELGFSESAAFQRAFKTWTGWAAGASRRGKA